LREHFAKHSEDHFPGEWWKILCSWYPLRFFRKPTKDPTKKNMRQNLGIEKATIGVLSKVVQDFFRPQ